MKRIATVLCLAFTLVLVPAMLPVDAVAQELAPTGPGQDMQHTVLPPPAAFPMPMLFLLGVLVSVLTYLHLRGKRRNELLARFIERSQEIPPELLPRQPSRHGARRAGTLLVAFAAGLGLLVFLMTGEGRPALAWSLLPLFLGIASFVNAAFFYPDSRR